MSKNALQKVEEFQFPEVVSVQDDGLEEDMTDIFLTFERVTVPSGGSIIFEIEGDDPENPETTKELVGVIVDHHAFRTYWSNPYSGEKTPPDCYSNDGRVGIGNPGGDCATCPLNQFGTGVNGRGKACKNQRMVYILREGDPFPLQLTLPPTSLKNFNAYFNKLTRKGRKTYGVITKITLKKARNKDNIEYSEVQFAVVRDLTPEEKAKAIIYAQNIREHTRRQNVADQYDDVDSSNGQGSEKVEISDDDVPWA